MLLRPAGRSAGSIEEVGGGLHAAELIWRFSRRALVRGMKRNAWTADPRMMRSVRPVVAELFAFLQRHLPHLVDIGCEIVQVHSSRGLKTARHSDHGQADFPCQDLPQELVLREVAEIMLSDELERDDRGPVVLRHQQERSCGSHAGGDGFGPLS